MKFKLNPKGIKATQAALEESWAEVMAALDIEFEEVIADPQAFSELGFNDQDLIDTGRFLKSQQVDVRRRIATFRWVARDPESGYPYPVALYTGYRAWGKKYIPGRRWIEKAVDRLDVPTVLKGKMRARGIKAKIKLKRKIYP